MLLSGPSDPLGLIAAQAATYEGRFYDDLSLISDDERRRYLDDMQKTALAMPLESVLLNFSITGVTRGFTHQMVRQRTAAYAQESQRFAVVEDSFVDRVALPPSIMGTTAKYHEVEDQERINSGYAGEWGTPSQIRERLTHAMTRESKEENWRWKWDEAVAALQKTYSELVNSGMPAEDARGLLPTNITTRIKYNTNLRALLEHISLRTCTQAQFEWRAVAAAMAKAVREYGDTTAYRVKTDTEIGLGTSVPAYRHTSSAWQYNAIADLFAPICYRQGKCTMKASFDRACSIRDRVDANAAANRPSSFWGTAGSGGLKPIFPAEWLLDPRAAR